MALLAMCMLWRSISLELRHSVELFRNSRNMLKLKREPSSLHHDLIGGKSHKIMSDASRIATIISKQGKPFLKISMLNLVTFADIPDSVSKNTENHDKLGCEALQKLVSTRMVEKTEHLGSSNKEHLVVLQGCWGYCPH